MSNGWPGPTTCRNGEGGNFMHSPWICVDGVPMFYVTGWFNSDGSYQAVPPNQRMPGASAPAIAGQTIVQMGTIEGGGKANTFWMFTLDVGYVDTHQKAEPLVVIDSSGNVTSPGYNPATGHWVIGQNPDGSEIVGVAPTNHPNVGGAYSQLQAAVEAIGSLLGLK